MLLVSPLINFMDRKGPAFCFCGVEFQLIRSILEVHTRINDARGRKMLRRLREWLRPPNSSSRIVLTNRNGSENCETVFGMRFRARYRRLLQMATRRLASPIP